ncbi:MAG: helix-turn-helix domain-containing protein, partial [Candidatus Eremiobacteraeota bacterium]|nr:helix-turn-helix domain-containing protein [Candidatus Eremiobacteraeota bacterium]
MPALGDRFRAAREARDLSLSDVAEQIRIRSVYLAAIEEENWKAIGAAVYARGFLRTYARFLGLDPEEVVAVFNASVGPAQEPATQPLPARIERSSKRGSLLIWVAAAVAALLVAYVFYNALTLRQQGAPIAAVTAAPTVLPSISTSPGATAAAASALPMTPTPSASPGGANTLALVLSAPSWLRVTVDGSVSM